MSFNSFISCHTTSAELHMTTTEHSHWTADKCWRDAVKKNKKNCYSGLYNTCWNRIRMTYAVHLATVIGSTRHHLTTHGSLWPLRSRIDAYEWKKRRFYFDFWSIDFHICFFVFFQPTGGVRNVEDVKSRVRWWTGQAQTQDCWTTCTSASRAVWILALCDITLSWGQSPLRSHE